MYLFILVKIFQKKKKNQIKLPEKNYNNCINAVVWRTHTSLKKKRFIVCLYTLIEIIVKLCIIKNFCQQRRHSHHMLIRRDVDDLRGTFSGSFRAILPISDSFTVIFQNLLQIENIIILSNKIQNISFCPGLSIS